MLCKITSFTYPPGGLWININCAIITVLLLIQFPDDICRDFRWDVNPCYKENMDKNLWKKCCRFHGDKCLSLAVACRACEVASEFLGIDLINSSDYNVICICENIGCGIDAIQVLTNCTVGNGKLIIRDTGKIAYSFYDLKTGENVRLVAKTIDIGSDERADILKHIFYAKTKDVFYVKELEYLPLGEGNPYTCYNCDICGEMTLESKLEHIDNKRVCKDCANKVRSE